MRPKHFAVYVVALVLVFAAIILWPKDGNSPPLTEVQGPVPPNALLIPSVDLDDAFIERVMTWGIGGNSPSYNDYQKFSESYWSAGLRFEGTFWVPVTWPEYLNLTGMEVELDPSGEYFLVPYRVYLVAHDRVLWIWAVLRGIFQQPYDAPDWWVWNHVGLYDFSILIRQERYAIRWYIYTQLVDQAFMYYNTSRPDAYTVPAVSPPPGLVPVLVDGQHVRSHGTIAARISRISEYGGSDYRPPGIDWERVLGNAAILKRDTIFVLGIPFDLLPHTSDNVVFGTMFLFSTEPPIGVRDPEANYFPLDYDPTPGPSPKGWNNTEAYVPVYAPL